MDEHISAEFSFQSQFVKVRGSSMHFVEQGEGDPILLVHGNPTSSYLWRNVIPHLSGQGRCIALDLIGMGKSSKPDIAYRMFDHAAYFEEFITALGLTNLRLVLHDWGGFLGLHYAARHQDNVRAIAMMECVIKPMKFSDRSEQTQAIFKMFRSDAGWGKIVGENFFVEKVLPGSIVRKLSEEEMNVYREPFLEESARKPVYVFPNEIPFDGEPPDIVAAVKTYDETLATADIPMLLLAFTPGAIIAPADVAWCREQFPSLTVKEMGQGIHFVQEDQPEAIGRTVAEWLGGLD
ncbi:MAG: haloalkane dehalogenase [SAR324 cluster bacterium]|nr:haloalkane dehalogenase [SAR324 cluster bacterium]MCZ6728134.1 haloalkane dehalogenase [SAR324 cluster bacterium]